MLAKASYKLPTIINYDIYDIGYILNNWLRKHTKTRVPVWIPKTDTSPFNPLDLSKRKMFFSASFCLKLSFQTYILILNRIN